MIEFGSEVPKRVARPSMITAAAVEHAPGAMPDATAGELTADFHRVHRNRSWVRVSSMSKGSS